MPFDREANAAQQRLIWRDRHEIVRIEPWGADSLRVRVTHAPEIRDDLPGALQPPAPVEADSTVGPEGASIRAGPYPRRCDNRGADQLLRYIHGRASAG